MSDALVVFHKHGHGALSKFLHPDFRHVFVAIKADGCWLTIDGRDGMPVIEVAAAVDYCLRSFYVDHGFIVVPTERRQQSFHLPVMAATCVSLVKRVLGIRAPWVLTPLQLCRYLTRG